MTDAPLTDRLGASLLRALQRLLRSSTEPRVARPLATVRDALRRDDLNAALRLMDRAWRILPNEATLLAPLFARLLAFAGRDADIALQLLLRARGAAPDPDAAALGTLSLLRLGRTQEAEHELVAALGDYCVTPQGLLGAVAGEFVRHTACAPGWVGRGSRLELVGNLAVAAAPLEIQLDGQPAFTQLLAAPRDLAFRLRSPQLRGAGRIAVRCRGTPLLGSAAPTPPAWGVAGSATVVGHRLRGWVRVGWRPDHPPRLRIADEHGHQAVIHTAEEAQEGWRWPFTLNWRARGLRAPRLALAVRGPNGWVPLPESPLDVAASVVTPHAVRAPRAAAPRALDEARLRASGLRFVLLVTLALPGGVDRFVVGRCRDLRAQGLHPLVLRPAAPGTARRCELWTDAAHQPTLRYDIPREIDALDAFLRGLDLAHTEIQHFLQLDARVVERVRALPVPYDVMVHDYAWLCPRVTLINETGRYCGEPAVAVCRSCVRRNGSNLGERITVPALRARSTAWLGAARSVTAPSADAAARIGRHFPGIEVRVRPHTAPSRAGVPAPAPAASRVRVALLGGIGNHKGYRHLRACARDARARRLPLEFVVIGYTQNDAPLLAMGNVFITGPYDEPEAPGLLRREAPDVAWLPSVWPETWCYTLDYVLAAGLPVLAFDLGAIAERLRAARHGTLLELGAKPASINDTLLHLAAARRALEVPSAPNAATITSSTRDETTMTTKDQGAAVAAADADGSVGASVQMLPLPAGMYLFSVKAASAARGMAGSLSLPAVQIGLGPGVKADHVEFMTGPTTHGTWLFAPGDLVVAKVHGAGATLILTSMRGPGGDVLDIKVERLDARGATTADAAAGAGLASNVTSLPAARKPDGAEPFVRLQIGAHVRTRGDLRFIDAPWAGRVGPGLWIESFSVLPLERLAAGDVEYKGLTGSGFETPWISDDKMCGTKGMAVPLVGFAIRLKPGAAGAAYELDYSGYFQSGVTIGPVANGAPCRSTVANDPLEGIQIRLHKRAVAAPKAEAATPPADDAVRAGRGSRVPANRRS